MSEGIPQPHIPGFAQGEKELFAVVLARIDERTKNTDARLLEIAGDVKALGEQVAKSYVTQSEFKNLSDKVALHQKIIFSTIGLICVSVLGAVLALVIQKGGSP